MSTSCEVLWRECRSNTLDDNQQSITWANVDLDLHVTKCCYWNTMSLILIDQVLKFMRKFCLMTTRSYFHNRKPYAGKTTFKLNRDPGAEGQSRVGSWTWFMKIPFRIVVIFSPYHSYHCTKAMPIGMVVFLSTGHYRTWAMSPHSHCMIQNNQGQKWRLSSDKYVTLYNMRHSQYSTGINTCVTKTQSNSWFNTEIYYTFLSAYFDYVLSRINEYANIKLLYQCWGFLFHYDL